MININDDKEVSKYLKNNIEQLIKETEEMRKNTKIDTSVRLEFDESDLHLNPFFNILSIFEMFVK